MASKKVDLMDFNRFKAIMNTLIEFRDKRNRVSDFFEKELCADSWCLFTYGNDIENTLINMLADEFNCWYYIPRRQDPEGYEPKQWWEQTPYYDQDNDINYWLYEVDEKNYTVTIDGKEISILSLEDFYNYLVKYYK